MKTQVIKTTLLGFALLISAVSFAQKKNVQNAIMDFKSYEKALQSQNMSGAKKAILSAKSSIDLAAENAETAQDIKMLFYKGKIYMGLSIIAALNNEDEELKAFANEQTLESALDAWKVAYQNDTKNRHRDDIKQQIFMISGQSNTAAGTMFSEGNYEEAFELYASSVALFDVIKEEALNYGATAFNAGLCADRINKPEEAFKYFELAAENGFEPENSSVRAANALYAAGKEQEAMTYIMAVNAKYPGDGRVIVSMADIALKTGNDDVAMKSLSQAVEKEPSNAVYHWALGTLYQKKGNESEAAVSFQKAMNLDPTDDRAFYSLGSMHFNKAVDLLDQARNLKLNDPNFDVLENQAVEEFKKAAPHLEKVLELQGDANNKALLMNLTTIHRKLGNAEKALDFKKRADAVK